MADDQAADDRSAGAVADHHRGGQAKGAQQRRGVVGLLGDVGGGPTGRARAAGEAATVIGHHRELLGKEGHEVGPLAGVAGATGDEQQGGPLPWISWNSLVVPTSISPDAVIMVLLR